MKQKQKRTILDRMSRNEVAGMFYQISKEKKMVAKTVNSFRRHPHFSMIREFFPLKTIAIKLHFAV